MGPACGSSLGFGGSRHEIFGDSSWFHFTGVEANFDKFMLSLKGKLINWSNKWLSLSGCILVANSSYYGFHMVHCQPLESQSENV